MLLKRLIWNRLMRSATIWGLHHFCKVKKGRVICISWSGQQFNCNPRALALYIVRSQSSSQTSNSPRFSVHYALNEPEKYSDVPHEIHKVLMGSFEYFHLLATAQFVIANTRFAGGYLYPWKQKGQYYIQTMHGGHGLKRVEMDANLSPSYQKALKKDADFTDLMLSDSHFWTDLAHNAFCFHGTVMEVGLPRNDVFFSTPEEKTIYKQRVIDYTHIPADAKILVYAPTFRNNGRTDVYGFDVNRVVEALEQKWGGTWYVLVSSHPNMLGYYRKIYDFSHPRLVDVGMYPDLQDILIAGNALITDYSSAGMEFSLDPRPVFLLARDVSDYDRGFYFDIHNLPYPLAETDDQLIQNIADFDEARYKEKLSAFNREKIGLCETGHASQAVVEWMIERYNQS